MVADRKQKNQKTISNRGNSFNKGIRNENEWI